MKALILPVLLLVTACATTSTEPFDALACSKYTAQLTLTDTELKNGTLKGQAAIDRKAQLQRDRVACLGEIK